ncbi:MAG: VWA domain-containing protein [Roseibium sp.]|uniref:vWA domain-containing protein n=1 Tax=Roseibium sp. TaxID=1936156 RepID=UPI001B28364B|nr:VWA domain-containing protein [Roseibium sp.]MBO6895457.1 VWA domain-containing protein [Roseibium sp.]MBO6931556.1 VWA domain-containing protein [Roseibium sp.]
MDLSSTLQRWIFAALISFGLTAHAGLLNAWAQEPAIDPEKRTVMMVLDGSNSMWGQINGVAKISIAKDTMSDLIRNWDFSTPMGLMMYGHRRKNDCSDIEIISTPGFGDRQTFIQKVQSVSPRGKTPIAASLGLAAVSTGAYTGKKVDIVLVSDGLETCQRDPCQEVQVVKQLNVNFRAHVIGFDVTDVEFEQLQCIATSTGGQFFRANNAQELKEAITNTVAVVTDDGVGNASEGQGTDSSPVPTEEPPSTLLYGKLCETCERLEPLDVNWNVLKDGVQHHAGLGVIYPRDTHQFTPGSYEVTARLFSSQAVAKGEIEIGEDGQQIGALNLNAGSITTFAVVNEEDKQAAQTALYKFYPVVNGEVGGEIATAYNNQGEPAETWLNAGRYRITVSVGGNVTDSTEIELAAGEQVEHTFDLRSGTVAPKVFLNAGAKQEVNFGFLTLFPEGSGSKVIIGYYGNKKTVKPGRYDLEVVMDSTLGRVEKRFPIEVKPGDQVTGPFVMDAVLFTYNVTRQDGGAVKGVTLLSEREDKSGFVKTGFAWGNPKGTGIGKPGRHKLQIGNDAPLEVFELILGEKPDINVEVQ